MFILNKSYSGTLLVNLCVIDQTLGRDVIKQTFVNNNNTKYSTKSLI